MVAALELTHDLRPRQHVGGNRPDNSPALPTTTSGSGHCKGRRQKAITLTSRPTPATDPSAPACPRHRHNRQRPQHPPQPPPPRQRTTPPPPNPLPPPPSSRRKPPSAPTRRTWRPPSGTTSGWVSRPTCAPTADGRTLRVHVPADYTNMPASVMEQIRLLDKDITVDLRWSGERLHHHPCDGPSARRRSRRFGPLSSSASCMRTVARRRKAPLHSPIWEHSSHTLRGEGAPPLHPG